MALGSGAACGGRASGNGLLSRAPLGGLSGGRVRFPGSLSGACAALGPMHNSLIFSGAWPGSLLQGDYLSGPRLRLRGNSERRASTTTRGAPRLGQKLSAVTSMQLQLHSLTEQAERQPLRKRDGGEAPPPQTCALQKPRAGRCWDAMPASCPTHHHRSRLLCRAGRSHGARVPWEADTKASMN